MDSTKNNASQYANRIAAQVAQYKDVEKMHDNLSNMHQIWRTTYVTPVFREVTASNNHIDFYAKEFIEGMEKTGEKVISSYGSGDGAVEVAIAQHMLRLGVTDFTLECLELSEHQLERTEKNMNEAGVAANMRLTQADFNKWVPDGKRAALMGHHALHHVLDLEHLFTHAREALAPDGKFVTMDIIGRNGHMRWPETLDIVEGLWAALSKEKRYHNIFNRTDDKFVNWDCSVEGFEGIRAQDILPLMIENFEFETFYAYGGLTEVFLSRGFGANYDPDNEDDVRFIDFLHNLNERLIDLGHIKPTILIASCAPTRSRELRMYKQRTPELCVRVPGPGEETPAHILAGEEAVQS